VRDALESMAPDGLGDLHCRVHRRGIKAWFGAATPPKAHYEAQVLPLRLAPDGEQHHSALEIGFHAEFPEEPANEAELEALEAERHVWGPELGPEAEAGPFLGRDSWRRLSEVWFDDDLDDPDLAFEIAGRLVDYLVVLEPARLAATKAAHGARR